VEAEALCIERSWKRKQARKRLSLYGTGIGSKKYSTASTSLFLTYNSNFSRLIWRNIYQVKSSLFYRNIQNAQTETAKDNSVT